MITALPAGTQWAAQLVTGALATSVGILAIGMIGCAALGGRLPARSGLRAVIGLVILFSAPHLARTAAQQAGHGQSPPAGTLPIYSQEGKDGRANTICWTCNRPDPACCGPRLQPGGSCLYGADGQITGQTMSHSPKIVTCRGPADPHALDGIPALPRTGDLDRPCAHCHGRGQWNREFDLASQRSKRALCPHCEGRGWIETGNDPVPSHDTALNGAGRPRWIVRFDPADDQS